MSAAPRWQVRVDTAGGSGSGFLIDAQHILTCAHVVGDAMAARVSFLQPSPGGLDGAVVFRGPWSPGEVDEGDVAVIRLTEPVEVEPARLAPLNGVEIFARQELGAFGFPDGYRKTGQIAHFHADAYPRLAGQACQTTASETRGTRLERGYSGSAAYVQGTYEVVGMVISADRDPDMRTGVVLPLDEIGRHWPFIIDRMRLGPFDSIAYRELRAILDDLKLPDMRRLPMEVLGHPTRLSPDPPQQPLSSVLAMVEWLAVNTTFPEDEVVDLVVTLLRRIGLKSPDHSAALHEWVGRHGWSAGDATSVEPATEDAGTRPGWVVVRIAPSAEGRKAHHVTIWTATNPDGGLDERTLEETVTEDKIQETIEQHLPEAYRKMMHATYETIAVEFVLPRGHLGWPVDSWRALDDHDQVPLGWSRPVVVRALEWFDTTDPRMIEERTRQLRDRPGHLNATMSWLDCSNRTGELRKFKAWLRSAKRPLALGLAGRWTEPDRIGSAVASGLPVLLWQRAACACPETETICASRRFSDTMATRLGDIRSEELPARVRDLRVEAAELDDEDEHCGRDVTLLWDEPRRRPTRLSFAE
ncbi:trypsin-like peptidase domain-containing protein [Micromonospora sp. H61]|uniref:VMAP-C domain-containing protein n=1 Tax=Micromonospora sp. H61 TaxID=2824888 RepID=UPI0027DBEE17|nr:trypsin-like peptidase domain-containing protein [Micromonospora sp. H61]